MREMEEIKVGLRPFIFDRRERMMKGDEKGKGKGKEKERQVDLISDDSDDDEVLLTLGKGKGKAQGRKAVVSSDSDGLDQDEQLPPIEGCSGGKGSPWNQSSRNSSFKWFRSEKEHGRMYKVSDLSPHDRTSLELENLGESLNTSTSKNSRNVVVPSYLFLSPQVITLPWTEEEKSMRIKIPLPGSKEAKEKETLIGTNSIASSQKMIYDRTSSINSTPGPRKSRRESYGWFEEGSQSQSQTICPIGSQGQSQNDYSQAPSSSQESGTVRLRRSERIEPNSDDSHPLLPPSLEILDQLEVDSQLAEENFRIRFEELKALELEGRRDSNPGLLTRGTTEHSRKDNLIQTGTFGDEEESPEIPKVVKKGYSSGSNKKKQKKDKTSTMLSAAKAIFGVGTDDEATAHSESEDSRDISEEKTSGEKTVGVGAGSALARGKAIRSNYINPYLKGPEAEGENDSGSEFGSRNGSRKHVSEDGDGKKKDGAVSVVQPSRTPSLEPNQDQEVNSEVEINSDTSQVKATSKETSRSKSPEELKSNSTERIKNPQLANVSNITENAKKVNGKGKGKEVDIGEGIPRARERSKDCRRGSRSGDRDLDISLDENRSQVLNSNPNSPGIGNDEGIQDVGNQGDEGTQEVEMQEVQPPNASIEKIQSGSTTSARSGSKETLDFNSPDSNLDDEIDFFGPSARSSPVQANPVSKAVVFKDPITKKSTINSTSNISTLINNSTSKDSTSNNSTSKETTPNVITRKEPLDRPQASKVAPSASSKSGQPPSTTRVNSKNLAATRPLAAPKATSKLIPRNATPSAPQTNSSSSALQSQTESEASEAGQKRKVVSASASTSAKPAPAKAALTKKVSLPKTGVTASKSTEVTARTGKEKAAASISRDPDAQEEAATGSVAAKGPRNSFPNPDTASTSKQPAAGSNPPQNRSRASAPARIEEDVIDLTLSSPEPELEAVPPPWPQPQIDSTLRAMQKTASKAPTPNIKTTPTKKKVVQSTLDFSPGAPSPIKRPSVSNSTLNASSKSKGKKDGKVISSEATEKNGGSSVARKPSASSSFPKVKTTSTSAHASGSAPANSARAAINEMFNGPSRPQAAPAPPPSGPSFKPAGSGSGTQSKNSMLADLSRPLLSSSDDYSSGDELPTLRRNSNGMAPKSKSKSKSPLKRKGSKSGLDKDRSNGIASSSSPSKQVKSKSTTRVQNSNGKRSLDEGHSSSSSLPPKKSKPNSNLQASTTKDKESASPSNFQARPNSQPWNNPLSVGPSSQAR